MSIAPQRISGTSSHSRILPLTDFVGGCREYFTALVENGKCVRRFDTAHGEYFLPTQHAEIYRLEDWGDMSTELEYVSTEREERRENAAGVDEYNADCGARVA